MPSCVAKARTRPRSEDASRIRAGFEKRPRQPPPSVGGMTIALQYCHITVNDVDESLAFYRDALGLEVRNDVGLRRVTAGSRSAAPTSPDLEIVLSEPHAGRSQADGDAMQELLTKGVLPDRSSSAPTISTPPSRQVRAVRRRGAPGAHRPAVGPARLRVPRPVRQHGALPPVAAREPERLTPDV